MKETDHDIDKKDVVRLRQRLQAAVGMEPRFPRHFAALSDYVLERTNQHISPTTLKRLWGYLDEGVQPRKSTLDILAQSVGYGSWEDFCRQEAQPTEESEAQPCSTPAGGRSSHLRTVAVAVCAVIILFVGGLALWSLRPKTAAPTADKHTLVKGQTFATADDYLRLFGIHASDTLWFQPVPRQEHLYVWGPQYGHPVWHNEGDALQLMPTITEYWEPASGDSTQEVQQLVEKINRDGYYLTARTNDLRITFMRGLHPDADSTYVFLGVYRFSAMQSDTTRVVWERVADECDLENLDRLLQLR